MREFTFKDFLKLREELHKLKTENNLFKDEKFEDNTRRTFLHPVIRVMSPEDDESLDYSKQILNVLIDNYYTVSLGEILLKDEYRGTNNYRLSVLKKVDKEGNREQSEIFLKVNSLS